MHPEPINLLGLDAPALTQLVGQWGGKPFRARQLQKWVHQRNTSQFDAMTDLARDFRAQLSAQCVVQPPTVLTQQRSTDGTRKWLFDVGQGNAIEAVFIPEDDRGTLCISSQAGCNVGCRFCSTGHQGFNRNLTAAEIIGQLWWARHELLKDIDDSRLAGADQTANTRVISNVVMMGMGEPLLNYEPVVTALRLMLDDNAYGLSRRRVTVSTSGVVPMIDRLAKDCPVALAVSLHAPNDALRDQLVPLNKKYPLAELFAACERYLEFAPRDFITFEYCMLKGVNDQLSHAQELVALIHKHTAQGLRCKFNLIPFNPFKESGLFRSEDATVEKFASVLIQAGFVTTIRKTRGDDIDAACGQLAGDVKDRTGVAHRIAQQRAVPIQWTDRKFS